MARSNSARASVDHPPAAAGVLLERGRALLCGGEACELGSLLDAVAALQDADRGLWVLLGLIDQELELAPADAAARAATRLELASTSLDLLEREPREPELLLRTGRLLDLLGQTDCGGALAGAARTLEPALRSAGGRLAIARRSRTTDPELVALSRRAEGVLELARPAAQGRVSLCMIVRDEQDVLARCLDSAAGFVDEIVVHDTGSSDRTPEIARSFGAHVIRGEWEQSFAAARNVSLEAASGDWILFLDADEVLVEGDGERLRALTQRSWCEGFHLPVINHTGSPQEGTTVTHSALRMFRNRRQYRFEGRLHEQIAHRLPSYLPGRVRDSGVRIEHFGYLHAVRARRGKSTRNLELLRLQQAEECPSAFLYFNMGSEHAAAGDHEAAVADLERAWRMLHEQGSGGEDFAAALIKRLVGALRACGRDEEADERAQEGLEQFPGFIDLIFERAMASAACGHEQAAVELLERCLQMGEPAGSLPSSAGCGSYLALVELAALRHELGEEAVARELLERCLQEHPGYTGSIAPYVALLTREAASGEEIAHALEGLLGEMPAHQRLAVALALGEAGEHVAAQIQLEVITPEESSWGAARVALAELLVAQRRYLEAAEAVSVVGSEDSSALPASRLELTARIAGAHADVNEALDRARTCGMRSAEIELFRGWRELSEHGRTERRPSIAVTKRLLALLDILLAAHDFEGFELLLGLLARSPMQERERREALAEMYLRRGFLASAAEEWMAVCHSVPDVRALLGLARVALARGMARESEEFAGAALELDPENEAALGLLAQPQPVST